MAGENEFYLDIVSGHKSRYSTVAKFGRNDEVGTSFVPIAMGGVYRTPQVGSATALRVKAGNVSDTSDGSGAREITIIGIDENGDQVSEALATAGTSASSNSVNNYIRIYRAFVSASGTYATATTGSHAADLVIENAAGTEDWLTIDSTGFPHGQSEVGAYTVPNGYKAFIKNIHLEVDSAKAADILLFRRTGALDTSAPYNTMRAVQTYTAVSGSVNIPRDIPIGPFVAGEDVGFMGKVTAGTAAVAVDFDIILYES